MLPPGGDTMGARDVCVWGGGGRRSWETVELPNKAGTKWGCHLMAQLDSSRATAPQRWERSRGAVLGGSRAAPVGLEALC